MATRTQLKRIAGKKYLKKHPVQQIRTFWQGLLISKNHNEPFLKRMPFLGKQYHKETQPSGDHCRITLCKVRCQPPVPCKSLKSVEIFKTLHHHKMMCCPKTSARKRFDSIAKGSFRCKQRLQDLSPSYVFIQSILKPCFQHDNYWGEDIHH